MINWHQCYGVTTERWEHWFGDTSHDIDRTIFCPSTISAVSMKKFKGEKLQLVDNPLSAANDLRDRNTYCSIDLQEQSDVFPISIREVAFEGKQFETNIIFNSSIPK